MKTAPDTVGKAGLAFFGKISASISHELKNVLSIINESAGLLEDLTLLAQKSAAIAPDRLLSTTKKIQHQVSRSDDILQHMNRFSHSIDRSALHLDLRDLVSNLLFVTKRITDMKGIKITYPRGETPISITTAPFFLMTLLWHLLEFVIGQAGESKAVTVTVTQNAKSAGIHIGCPDKPIAGPIEGFPDETQTALIDTLTATITFASGGVLLSLPIGSR